VGSGQWAVCDFERLAISDIRRFLMRLSLSSRFLASRFLAGILTLLSLPCFAAEVAVLRNGFTIRYERREVMGGVTRMYVSADGSSYVDVPTAEIEHFEVAEEPAAEAGLRASGSGLPASGAMIQSASRAADLNAVIVEASGRYRLDPDLVNSVIKAESGFNVRAVSPKGAQGLMQLMPGTASQLGVPNAFDPEANVDGGARYLRELLERYNFDLVKALAAYNAGTRRVEQYGGVPPYHETRAYVRRIVLDFNKKKLAQKQAVAQQKTSSKANVSTSAKKRSGQRADAKTNLARAAE
jgi:soluble lytic murein transglycosylase-like protein